MRRREQVREVGVRTRTFCGSFEDEGTGSVIDGRLPLQEGVCVCLWEGE